MCFVRPALLYLNMHDLKVFYEQINYYYYYHYYYLLDVCCLCQWSRHLVNAQEIMAGMV